MTTQPAASVGAQRAERTDRQHMMRIGVIWVSLSLIAMALVYFAWGPHMPPGTDSKQARIQQDGNRLLATVAVPVFVFVWVYLAYVLTNWRVKSSTPVDEVGEGPPLRGHVGFQAAWLGVTTVTVLSLFVFGTVDLAHNDGAGTGSGQAPIWTPAGYAADATKSKLLVVQVIGQQWRWTFRYPQYGGIETSQMVIPAGQEV
jgi:cytochrome c oxidase subunit II